MTEIIINATISLVIIKLLTINQKGYWEDHFKVILRAKLEIVVCLILLGLSYSSIELHKVKKNEHTEFTIGSLDHKSIEQINFLDRSIAGRWDIEAKDNGKIFKNIAIYLIPLFLFLFKGSIKKKACFVFYFFSRIRTH
ncbi:hypothetical protein [Maribacter halichondriae]|uniref:hypothetical protein n=1 Tax=Maribacter halichondriae TaxID=2980554 RepID=UPI002358AC6D|nr:hypothetical protein [Maribacter sp. Hal144]